MSRRRGANIKREARLDVYQRDNYTCQYCFRRLTVEDCTLDHVIPYSICRSNVRTNLVTCCRECNGIKADEVWPIGYMSNPVAALNKAWKVSA